RRWWSPRWRMRELRDLPAVRTGDDGDVAACGPAHVIEHEGEVIAMDARDEALQVEHRLARPCDEPLRPHRVWKAQPGVACINDEEVEDIETETAERHGRV